MHLLVSSSTADVPDYEACEPAETCACIRVPMHSIVEAADSPAAEQHLLTIGRAGVLSNRAIGAEELDTLLRLLGPMSERQRSDVNGRPTSCSLRMARSFIGPVQANSSPTLLMRRRAYRRRWHEHRRSQARAGPAPQLSRSSETVAVCYGRRSRRLGGAHRRADPRSRAARCAGCSSMPRDRAARAQWPRSKRAGPCCRAVLRSWSRLRRGSRAFCSASFPATLSPPTSLARSGCTTKAKPANGNVRLEKFSTISMT